MNLDRIPLELRERRQWLVWRAIPDGGRVTKPPYRASDPSRTANTSDPSTWSTFEEAVACYRKYGSIVSGIGYVFTRDDPYFGVDVDTEKKIAAENLERRRTFVRNLLGGMVTYTETSPSGDGLHLIARGQMPVAKTTEHAIGVELYGWNCFFTMTGDVLDETRTEIADHQGFLDQLQFRSQAAAGPLGDAPANRRMDLSDEEVLREASNYDELFAPTYGCQRGYGPGEWSDSFFAVVAGLDRVTGSLAQIERVVYGSPLVLQAPASNGDRGETRPDKARRILQSALAKARYLNDGRLSAAEMGRRIWANMEQTKRDRAMATTEAVRQADEALGLLSKGSASLLDAFPQLTHEHKVVSRPPGIVGEFVLAAERASFLPFTKYAIPAVLAYLSAVVGRGYKLPDGSGLNINVVLAAPTATGKTQAQQVLERFAREATRGMPATASGLPRLRIVNSSTSSIQAMMDEFQECPSIAWFCEECGAQLAAMSGGKNVVDSALRDSFNQLYDASKEGKMFSGPRSVSGRKAQLTPIENLNVSTFWTTVPSKLDIFTEDALDGFLSRVIVIRHTGVGGDPNDAPDELPVHLINNLQERMNYAQSIDDAYRAGQQPTLYRVSTELVQELNWQLVTTAHKLSRAALLGELPPSYSAVSRLPLTALRIAGTLAVMQSPWAPAITEEQLRWAFGYLLQNTIGILSDMDTGEVGQSARDDVMAVVRMVKIMLREKEFNGLPGIPKTALRNRLRVCKPFFSNPISPSKAVRDTLTGMFADRQIDEVEQPASGRGRPTTLVCPVIGDSIWH